MSVKNIRPQLRAMRRAVAFVQSGKVLKPEEHRREGDSVGNDVYRAFGQPLMGEATTPVNDQVRIRLKKAITRISRVDWEQ